MAGELPGGPPLHSLGHLGAQLLAFDVVNAALPGHLAVHLGPVNLHIADPLVPQAALDVLPQQLPPDLALRLGGASQAHNVAGVKLPPVGFAVKEGLQLPGLHPVLHPHHPLQEGEDKGAGGKAQGLAGGAAHPHRAFKEALAPLGGLQPKVHHRPPLADLLHLGKNADALAGEQDGVSLHPVLVLKPAVEQAV